MEATQQYIRAANQAERLSVEIEMDLARKAQQGDLAALDRLIRANLRSVVALALKFRRYGIDVADLIAEGNLGLLHAAKKFDPERGIRFATYATYWIRAYLFDSIVRSHSSLGPHSGPLRSKWYFRLRRERARAAAMSDDREEQLALLSERFDLPKETLNRWLQRLDAYETSLESPLSREGETSLRETLRDEESLDPEAWLAKEERARTLRRELRSALDGLDDRERLIVEQRILQDEELSLAAVGVQLGVSRERVRQLEVRAKSKLREWLAAWAPPAPTPSGI